MTQNSPAETPQPSLPIPPDPPSVFGPDQANHIKHAADNRLQAMLVERRASSQESAPEWVTAIEAEMTLRGIPIP